MNNKFLSTFYELLSLPTASDNCKSVLFFHEFVCFWIIALQNYVSFYYTTQWFNTSLYIKLITIVCVITISHHTEILQNYWLHSLPCTFHTHLFYNLKFLPLRLLHLFCSHFCLCSDIIRVVLCLSLSVTVRKWLCLMLEISDTI